jgi:hypothetical protein
MRKDHALIVSFCLTSSILLWACKTTPGVVAASSLLEESYSEVIPYQSNIENYNDIMLDSMAQANGREFWELYSIYQKKKGDASALVELDRIVRKHGITTALPYGCGTAFLSDEALKKYLTDTTLPRTRLFEKHYGNPVDWVQVKKKREMVFAEPLRWPPQSNSDYYSEKAKRALGLVNPRIRE